MVGPKQFNYVRCLIVASQPIEPQRDLNSEEGWSGCPHLLVTEVILCLGHSKMSSDHLHADSDGEAVNNIQQREEGSFCQEHAEFQIPTLLLDSDDVRLARGDFTWSTQIFWAPLWSPSGV